MKKRNVKKVAKYLVNSNKRCVQRAKKLYLEANILYLNSNENDIIK